MARIAIVGGGPAGLYAAISLKLKRPIAEVLAKIDDLGLKIPAEA